MKFSDLPWWADGLFALEVALFLPELPRRLTARTGLLLGPGPRSELLLGPLAALFLLMVVQSLTRRLDPGPRKVFDAALLVAVGLFAWVEVPAEYHALRALGATGLGPRLGGAGGAALAGLAAGRALVKTSAKEAWLPTQASLLAGAALWADFALTPPVSFVLAGLALASALLGMALGPRTRHADEEPAPAQGP